MVKVTKLQYHKQTKTKQIWWRGSSHVKTENFCHLDKQNTVANKIRHCHLNWYGECRETVEHSVLISLSSHRSHSCWKSPNLKIKKHLVRFYMHSCTVSMTFISTRRQKCRISVFPLSLPSVRCWCYFRKMTSQRNAVFRVCVTIFSCADTNVYTHSHDNITRGRERERESN